MEDSELEELVIPIWHKELDGLRSHVVLRWSLTGAEIGFHERVISNTRLTLDKLVWNSLPVGRIYPQCFVSLFRGASSNRK